MVRFDFRISKIVSYVFIEAYHRALEVAEKDMTMPVPLQIRNAPTSLMKDLGYAEGYRYNPDYASVEDPVM